VRIDSLEPLSRPGLSEDPLGLGENELESVHTCCVSGIGSAAAHPPRDGAPLHSQDGRELRLSPEVARQGSGLDSG
jgi:hypothetical protein